MKQLSHLQKKARRDEEGTTIILVALSLVVLMGFAAIAVDGAAAWALKRQDQSGADTGAIAGALFTAGRSKATAMQDAQDEIIRITYATMTPDMPFSDWETEWGTCTDPGKPAEYTETLGSDCISFTDNLDQVRVTTPIVPWYTTFGRVIGFDRIDTRAVAEVNTDLVAPGGVLPFGMPGSAAGADQICLKSGSNPNGEPPCDGPTTGNFGFLNFTQFGNPDLGTAQDCNPDVGTLIQAISTGIDHGLGTTPDPFAVPHEDRVACNDGNSNSQPYQVFTNTGNIAGSLDAGFADAGFGKLTKSGNTIDIASRMLDNTPLWDFLTDDGSSNDGESFCDAVVGPITDHDEMEACLAAYKTTTFPYFGWDEPPVLFSEDIINAARWGWVPLFHGTDLGAGTTALTIKEFRAVYIQTIFMDCTALTCNVIWDPGEPDTEPDDAKPNKGIEAATALQLPESSLPTAARLSMPGTDTQVQYLLSK